MFTVSLEEQHARELLSLEPHQRHLLRQIHRACPSLLISPARVLRCLEQHGRAVVVETLEALALTAGELVPVQFPNAYFQAAVVAHRRQAALRPGGGPDPEGGGASRIERSKGIDVARSSSLPKVGTRECAEGRDFVPTQRAGGAPAPPPAKEG